jgi:hypothetical protein
MPPLPTNDCIAGQVPDMYGQVHPVESSELIARKLAEMTLCLAEMTLGQKENVLKAQKKCPHLLTSEFQLLFLRCELFDAQVRTTA